MIKLLEARQRYTRLLDALSSSHELDGHLRSELQAAIANIDAKIEASTS